MSSGVHKQSAILNATKLAGEVKRNSVSKFPSDYIKARREELEFQILSLQAEVNLLSELAELSDEEKLETLFSLLDKDKDGTISATELADGLRKMRGDVSFQESLDLAIELVATYDQDGDAHLDLKEFEVYLKKMLYSIGCSYQELCEMLVVNVVFSSAGNTRVEDKVARNIATEVDEAVLEEEDYRKTLNDKRLKALFCLFDLDGDGTVDFKEVVVGMYKIMDGIEGASKAAVEALIMFDENCTRSFDFETFGRFIINIVAALPDGKTFDDVADSMTTVASKDVELSPEQINELFTLDEGLRSVVHLKSAATQEEEDLFDGVELGRIALLFDLWDLDKDGSIDFYELALGLRKFEKTTSLKSTVDETIKVLTTFHTMSEFKLDPKEFALFLVKFVDTCGADAPEMIDFMIVASALKDNTESEERYIQCLKASDLTFGEI